MHHPLRARDKAYEFIAVGILDQDDPEGAASFRQRVWRNALNFNGLRWQAGCLARAAGAAGIPGSVDRLLARMEAL